MLYTQLRSFHAVAVEGGFTAAARSLRIGQPTVTAQVRELELRYRVELFNRKGRRVVLTAAGRDLFAATQRIMAFESEARDILNAHGGFHAGRLTMAAVGPYHATEMLSAFNERYPRIELSVAIGNSQESLQRLLDYTADVGVLAQVEKLDPRYVVIPYSRHPVRLFFNTEHRFSKRRTVRLKELEGERVVLREVGSTTRREFETALGEAGVRIHPVLEIGSREAAWMAVERGIGIGVVSEIEFIPHPRLRMARITDADMYIYANVVCLAERKESRLVRAFLDVVADLMTSHR